ncbi:metalloregulator ArsR/SmtB family transcription factor [Deinococcus sp. HMF7620]|uniref:Metalloregulator ArsR/SmtB family transcription factor n=1 Tax=Deinococcus arboris TaxID=2682977 RepID=A0A7C9HRM9_9DEIO|nr:metalloregulator ArsR/SmtB family transcription factor [Deinococcus arboris]
MSAELTRTAALFRALSHPARLSLLRLVWTQEASGEGLARLMNLAPATVSHHLAQLTEAGLLTTRQDGHHRLHRAATATLDLPLGDLVRGAATPPSSSDPYEGRVLRAFFKEGRLTVLPAQHKKRDVVLRELASLFDPGRRYPEREVNAVLGEVYSDVMTLRRELVGLGVLAREAGVYWRPEATPLA